MNTKMDTWVLVIKGVCYVAIGVCTPIGTAITQWANSGETPSTLAWVGIVIGGCVGGATQLIGFLSKSYATYTGKAQSNGTTPPFKPTP